MVVHPFLSGLVGIPEDRFSHDMADNVVCAVFWVHYEAILISDHLQERYDEEMSKVVS